MSNRIQPGRPLPQEWRRLFEQQIADAISRLSQRRASASGVTEGRKHVKKARAILQLARRILGGVYDSADDALRTANRALGPMADANHMTETLDDVTRLAFVHLPPSALSATRTRLATRQSALNERAARDAVRARVIRLLDATRREAGDWNLSRLDRDEIIREIKGMHAASRRGWHLARRRPCTDSYHAWRRAVKREAYAFRLVADMLGARLDDERHQLAALATCLGDLHDVVLLMETIATDSPLSRGTAAATLRELRVAASDLRRRSHALSSVLDERPRDLGRRIDALWGLSPRSMKGAPVRRWLQRA